MLNRDIAAKLCEIEETFRAYGLTTVSRFTCIARDPEDVHMTVVTSNDDIAEACHVALTYTQ